jgi:hypothetical protein
MRYARVALGVIAFTAGFIATMVGVLDVGWGVMLCPSQAVEARYFCGESVRQGSMIFFVGVVFLVAAYLLVRSRDRARRLPQTSAVVGA